MSPDKNIAVALSLKLRLRGRECRQAESRYCRETLHAPSCSGDTITGFRLIKRERRGFWANYTWRRIKLPALFDYDLLLIN